VILSKGIFSDGPISILKQAINAALLRHRVISENISNVSTPGYKSRDISFKQHLFHAQARSGLRVAATHPSHRRSDSTPRVELKPVVDSRTGMGPAGNNVEIEEQVTKLDENGIAYTAYLQSLAGIYKRLDDSIKS
jgi:flagellar basal-body rod protein FlgB